MRPPAALPSILAVLLGLGAAGCGARAQAADVPEIPPLAMPLPPPRVIVPAEVEPVAALPGSADPALDADPPTIQKPPVPRRAAGNDSAPKPDAPAASAATTTGAPPAEPARQLRTADAAGQKQIGDLLGRAERDLNTVQRGLSRLSGANQEQYREARGYFESAQKALTERNFPFASVAAQKAADIAALLLDALR